MEIYKMNEQLKLKLLKQAGFSLHPHIENMNDGIDWSVWNYDLCVDQLIELVVRECIGVVEGGSFLHDQAPTAIFARECSGAIKRHFGVEE